jgi:hypothetical protein
MSVGLPSPHSSWRMQETGNVRLGEDLLIISFMHFLLQMEEYRFGDWVSGDKHTHAFDVDVSLRTTTTTTTTSTTTTISTTSALSTTELSLDDEYENKSAENTHLNDDKDLEEYGYEDSIEHHDYPEHQEDDKMLESNSTDAWSDIPIYDEYAEALAIEDEAQAAVILSNLFENI